MLRIVVFTLVDTFSVSFLLLILVAVDCNVCSPPVDDFVSRVTISPQQLYETRKQTACGIKRGAVADSFLSRSSNGLQQWGFSHGNKGALLDFPGVACSSGTQVINIALVRL